MASNQQVNIGVNTQGAEQDLADFAKHVNDFLSSKAAAAGKSPRLLDTTADKAALQELKKQMQEVINLSATLRGPLNSAGQGGANRPTTPSQINLSGISQSIAGQQRFMEHFMTRLLTHNANSSGTPLNTGLTHQELLGRPDRPAPHPAHDQFFKGSSAAGHLARQVSPLFGGAGGALGRAAQIGAEGFAGRGMAGFVGGGMAGLAAGAGIGLLGYGLYKGASAVNEGVDREKVLNTDIDKFRRSLGGSADSFKDLVDQSRMIGDAFNLVYAESRKISTEFANIAKSNVGAIAQASEGVGLAQAVGIDPSQGAGFMAHLRKDQSIGDKKSDARIMAIQFAEALKRTGSTLNASELMHAIQGFSTDTAHRGLSVANVDGYSGLLSAMVGAKIPGLDMGAAGSLLARADTSFQNGGGAGQASSTLQFMALGGDKTGLLGAKMRESAGMFATADSVFGDKNNPVNKYLGGDGMMMHKGGTTGLEDVIAMVKANSGGNKELEINTLAAHLKLNPNEAATFLNMDGKGNLGKTLGMARKYDGLDLNKMSSAGYTTLADVADADGDTGKLRAVQAGLGKRSDLSKGQTTALAAMKGLEGSKLQDALVQFAATMAREKNDGEKIAAAAATTANATDRMAATLIPASITTNNFLSEMVKAVAPNSPYLKEHEMQKFKDRVALSPEDIKSGKVSDGTISELNSDYIRDLRRPMGRSSGITSGSRMAVLEKQYRQLGFKMVTPKDVADSFEKGEIEAMKTRIDAENRDASKSPVTRKSEGGAAAGGAANDDAKAAINAAAAKYGINPDYLAGLAKLETQMGKKSIKGGGLDTNNLFNVKGNASNGIRAVDGAEGSNDYYSKYGSYGESADAVGSLISRKYPGAKNAKTPMEFATALKNGGYATDPNYARKLAGVIGDAPAKIPANDPAKAAAAAAEAQRVHVSVGEQKSSVTVNLVGAPGSGQPDQTVTSSGTSKAQPSGSVKSASPMRYKP